MGLSNFLGQKSRLDEIQHDTDRMKQYIRNVSNCIKAIDACWVGNKDKQRIVDAIVSHLMQVNTATDDLNVFRHTALFTLIKINELGSIAGLRAPGVSPLDFVKIFELVLLRPKIQIDTTALRNVADKIDSERKHLDETSFSITNTKNVLDIVVLNLFGLNGLLRKIDIRVAEQKMKSQKIVSAIRQICDLYDNAENRLKSKIDAIVGIGGTTTVVTPPVVSTPPVLTPKTPDVVSGGTSSGVEAGKIRQVIQQWHPNGGNPDYDPSVWGPYDSISGTACGVAAASMALSWLGIDMSPQKICHLNVANGDGADYMSSWDQLGCKYTKYATIDSTNDIDTALQNFIKNPSTYSPPIMYLTSPHFVVIMSETDTGYWTRDPGYPGEHWLPKPASYSEVKQFSLT